MGAERRNRGGAFGDSAEDTLNANTTRFHRSQSRAVARAAAENATIGMWLRLALAAALTMLALLWTQQAFARSAPESFADLVEQVIPAVVNVSSTQKVPQSQQMQDLDEMFRDFLDRREGQPQQRPPRGGSSLGSGFIIDPAGYIVTNNHVIEDAEEILVLTHDNEELKATIVGRDEKTDLALLKVDAKRPLPALKWGDSEALRIGDWVMAIGNPFGLGGSVTAGIVSARQRDINSGPYDDYIRPGKLGACDRYGNVDGKLVRTDPLVLLDRSVESGRRFERRW